MLVMHFYKVNLKKKSIWKFSLGFYDTKVCRLNKILYGLKQSSRERFFKFSTALIHEGFTESRVDYSIFTYQSNTQSIFVLIYVDDIIIIGNDVAYINSLRSRLES